MTKKVILAAVIGWGLSYILGPRDVLGWFRPKTA